MAMRLGMAFDHFNTAWNQAYASKGYYSDYPWSFASYGTLVGGGFAKLGNYTYLYLSAYTNNVASTQAMYGFLPLSAIWDVTKSRSYCGFRMQLSIPSGKSNYQAVNSVYNLLSYATAATTSATTYPLFNLEGIPNPVVGVDYYVEIMIDWVNKTRTIWVDGNLVMNAQALGFTPAQGGFLQFVASLGSSSSTTYGGQLNLTHMYFLDDAGDGAPDSTRLGPGVMTLCPVKDAAGAGWVSSDGGNFVTELNTAIASTPNPTPNLVAPGDSTPLDMHFDTSKLDPNGVLKFAMPILSSGRNTGTSTVTKSVLSDTASHSTRLPDLSYADANMRYNQSPGMITKNLDGTPLSLAQLQQLKLSVSAVTAGS
jgi:hypothetical protein